MASLSLFFLCPEESFSILLGRAGNSTASTTSTHQRCLRLSWGTILLGEPGTLELGVARGGGKFLELELVHFGLCNEGQKADNDWGEGKQHG
jgi:hypothetical protein